MKIRNNRLPLFIILFSLFTIQSLAQQNITLNKYSGSYYSGNTVVYSLLTLETNGQYSHRTGIHDGRMFNEFGTYKLSDNLLHFTIMKKILRYIGQDVEINLLDPNEVKKLNNGRDSSEIIKEFNMIPIEWSDRVYLIYEDDLMDFVNAVNLGIEPRTTMPAEPYYGDFYLREGDEQKQVNSKPTLPTEWQSFLLMKPVKAKIISIKVEGNDTIAQIDKGSQNGLKIGMKLLRQGHEPKSLSKDGIILTVSETTAEVYFEYAAVIGQILSSEYSK